MTNPTRSTAANGSHQPDKEEQILDAVLTLLARTGIGGISMRAIAAEAGVALGLINYHFEDKDSLIAAALQRIGDQDIELVAPVPALAPDQQVRHALRRVAEDGFLKSEYLGLRLQLWSLAAVDPKFGTINQTSQTRYRDGLGQLIATARPDLDRAEVERRSNDILVIQNGIWLTSILILDRPAIERSIERCIEIAFSP
ncbi:MAG: TetR/AcrR family transcriptional regulator [Acidimicrobiales bacterium]